MPIDMSPLTLGLPIIAAVIAGWLSHDNFSATVNALIAGFVVLICSVIWALVSAPLVGSLSADIALIAAYSGWALAGPLAPLNQYLTATLPSPLSWRAPARSAPLNAVSRQSMVSLAIAPITPRASALAPDQTWTNIANSIVTAPIPIPQPTQNIPEQTPPLPPAAS